MQVFLWYMSHFTPMSQMKFHTKSKFQTHIILVSVSLVKRFYHSEILRFLVLRFDIQKIYRGDPQFRDWR